MSKTAGDASARRKAILQVTLILISTVSTILAMSPGVFGLTADTVTLTDAGGNGLTFVPNGTMVVIVVSDGTTKGGMKQATVQEASNPANKITVTLYDNGAVFNDTATDGSYHGFFNVSNPATGGTTDGAKGRIAVPDNKGINVTADLDNDGLGGKGVVTTDFTKPTVKVTSAKDIVVSGNYYLRVQATDLNIKGAYFEVDGGTEQPTTLQGSLYLATIDTKPLTEDVHSVKVMSRDLALNENSLEFNITADRTPPFVKIKTNPTFVMASYILNVTVTDLHLNTTTILYRVDADTTKTLIPKVANDTFTTSVDLSALDEGLHTIYVEASDAASNTNNSQFVKVTLDRTKPAITWNTPAGTVTKDNFDINISVTDANMNTNEVKYKLDGGLTNVIPAKGGGYFETQINTIPFQEGTHNIVLVIKDQSGNTNQTAPFNFIVDRTNPTVNITSAMSVYCKDKYILTADVKDANLDKVYYVQGANTMPIIKPTGSIYTAEINVSTWKESIYSVTVKAQDKAGNTKESNPITLVVDITPPSFTHTLVKTDTGFKLDVVVSDANLNTTTVGYSLDGKPKKEFDNILGNRFTALIAKADFGKGNHTITLYADDKAGNKAEKTYNEALIIPPPVISGLSIKDLYDGKIQLSWKESAATDLAHYNIYYRAYDVIQEVTGLTPAMSIPKGTNTTTITGLALQTRYYFGVTAVDTFGYENKTVTPISGTSIESPKIPTLTITLITAKPQNNIKAGDTVTYTITVKNTGNLNASTIKVSVVVDNNIANYENIDSLPPGQTQTVTIDWNAEEGTHNVNVTVIQGQSVLSTKPAYSTPIVVKPSKGTVINNGGFNLWYIVAIVGVIAGVGILAFAWRTTKKQDEEIKQEEIELGLRPDKDGKRHAPPGQGPPKPGGPEKPVVKQSHSPDVYIPSSPLLQQPPQQPPAAPPQQPPAQPPQQ